MTPARTRSAAACSPRWSSIIAPDSTIASGLATSRPASAGAVPCDGWNSPWLSPTSADGANPSPLAFSEVFVALQTGVMDAQENPLAQIYPARFYEVQKYLSMTGHVYTPAYVTAGASWAKLPPDVQKILTDTAVEMQPVVYKIAAGLDESLFKKLKDAGMQVNDADKDAFIKASKPIYDEFAKEVPGGKELIDKSLALAN